VLSMPCPKVTIVDDDATTASEALRLLIALLTAPVRNDVEATHEVLILGIGPEFGRCASLWGVSGGDQTESRTVYCDESRVVEPDLYAFPQINAFVGQVPGAPGVVFELQKLRRLAFRRPRNVIVLFQHQPVVGASGPSPKQFNEAPKDLVQISQSTRGGVMAGHARTLRRTTDLWTTLPSR